MSLKLRRGTDAERLTIIPDEGELIYTTDFKRLYVGDGETTGGNSVLGTFSAGELNSDLYIKTYRITNNSNLILNGSTGAITGTAASLTSLSSSNTFMSSNGNAIGQLSIIDHNQIIINNKDGSVPFLKINSVTSGNQFPYIEYNLNKSTNITSSVSTGDTLSQFRFRAFNGNSFQLTSQLQFMVDNSTPISGGNIPGKIVISTLSDGNVANSKFLSFDSQGRLGINTNLPNAILDVNGSCLIRGTAQFGFFTTAQRDALTVGNGTIIYNTTANRFQGYQNNSWINLDDGSAA